MPRLPIRCFEKVIELFIRIMKHSCIRPFYILLTVIVLNHIWAHILVQVTIYRIDRDSSQPIQNL